MPESTFDIQYEEGLPLPLIHQGYSWSISVELYEDDSFSVPKDLTVYSSLRLSVKDRRSSPSPMIDSGGSTPNATLSAEINPANSVRHLLMASMTPMQTGVLLPTSAIYEVKGIKASGEADLLLAGPLSVIQSVVPIS